MPRPNAAEKAQAQLDKVDEKIAVLDEKRKAAIAKVEERYAGDAEALLAEREHAAKHPALQASVTA